MKSVIIALIIGVIFSMQGVSTKTYETISDCFGDSSYIEVIIDNQNHTYKNHTVEYQNILNQFMDMIKDSHQMPAFGVSLDNETKSAIKNGLWIKFCFDFIGYNSQMPFEELLINVNKDFSGFNIIRGNNGLYEGRCFYINLVGDMNNLYDYLIEYIV